MTQLRKQMLDELQRRNYSQTTVKSYLKVVESFAKHFHRAPDQRLPTILTQDEAIRLIDSASNLFHRAMLMTVYSTGMRRAEMRQLKVEDIDSSRMVIPICQSKGRRDRDVPLSPKLLETLREYWRWMKPKTYFSGHSQWLAGRQTDHAQNALGSLPRSGATRRHHQARTP